MFSLLNFNFFLPPQSKGWAIQTEEDSAEEEEASLAEREERSVREGENTHRIILVAKRFVCL